MSGSQFISTNIFDILDNNSEKSYRSEKTPVRKNAISVLSDKNTLDKCLTRTKMCNSIENGKPCPYKDKCRFAHTLKELVITECLFKHDCRYVYNKNFKWHNKEGKKVCFHKHPSELDSDYLQRIGVNKKEVKSIEINISNINDLEYKMKEAISQGITEININVD